MQRKNLGNLLSVISGGITFSLAAVLVILSYFIAYNAVENAFLNQLQNLSRDITRQMEDFYELELNNATFLSGNDVLINSLNEGSYGQASVFLHAFAGDTDRYENVFISTPSENPRIVAASAADSIGVEWGGVGFDDNIAANLNGQRHVSEPYLSPVTGIPVVLLSAPILSGNQLIGIVGVAVNLGTFTDPLVNQIQIGKTGYPFISDGNGMIVAHPNTDHVFELDLSQLSWWPDVEAAEPGEIVYYTFEGDAKFLVYQRNERFNFITYSNLNVEDIQDEAFWIALYLILVGLLGTAISIFFTHRFIQKRLQPLHEAVTAIRDLAEGEGDLTRQLTVSSNDEISELSESINRFVEKIHDIVVKLKEAGAKVTESSTQVSETSQNMSAAVEEVSQQSQSIASSATQMDQNLSVISSSIEEMSISIGEVAKQAQEAASIAGKANTSTQSAAEVFEALSTGAREIGQRLLKVFPKLPIKPICLP